MIDEYWTWQFYGYYSYELNTWSRKSVVARCDGCCQYRVQEMRNYRGRCKSCAKKGERNSFFGKHHTEESNKKNADAHKDKSLTEEHKHKIGEAGKGRRHTEESKRKMSKSQKARKFPPMNGANNSFFGKHHTEESKKMMSEAKLGVPLTDEHKQNALNARLPVTDETKQKMSEMRKGEKHWCFGKHRSDEVKQKISGANTGRIISGESRRKHSATLQGIPYEDWIGFAEREGYCEKFDDACRERIRAKYGHRCFLCGKPYVENITKTNKPRALSVHHFDMNKDAGCNGNAWKLVPLCMCCHGSAHSKTWTTRIEYLLEYVWK